MPSELDDEDDNPVITSEDELDDKVPGGGPDSPPSSELVLELDELDELDDELELLDDELDWLDSLTEIPSLLDDELGSHSR